MKMGIAPLNGFYKTPKKVPDTPRENGYSHTSQTGEFL